MVNKPTITELLSLLDKETLSALTERLHTIADAHVTPRDPGQLLFEFLDDGIAAFEQEIDDNPDAQKHLALEILEVVES